MNAIIEISTTIEKLSEISSAIASAVEQQGAATQNISRNVQQAADGTRQVSTNIAEVQRGATETGTASSQVLTAAQTLSADSNRLKAEVRRFLELGSGGLTAAARRFHGGAVTTLQLCQGSEWALRQAPWHFAAGSGKSADLLTGRGADPGR